MTEDIDTTAIGWFTPTRVEMFSDAVIAIVSTLLILEVKAPPAHEALLTALLREWSQFVAYVLSFVVIGVYWINHHGLFCLVRRVDRTAMLLNLGLLMTIAFLPFSTAIVGTRFQEGGAFGASVFFTLSLGAVTAWFIGLCWYLLRQPDLLVPGAGEVLAPSLRYALVGFLGYPLAIVLAFVSPVGTLVFNVLIAVYFLIYLRPEYILRRRERAERTA